MALYIVATPIGHLKDITLRAIETLKQVDLIAAEDTRTAKKLCNEYDIQTKLVSYHGHSTDREHERLLSAMEDGNDVALISEAGTPGISDPGEKLIREAVNRSIEVIPIPGVTALMAALVASGLSLKSFTFMGFIPHKKGRMTFLQNVLDSKHTVVFYESCHRIKKLITQMSEFPFEKRTICIGREITKMYETWYRGTLEEIISLEIPEKGEFSVVVQGK